MVSECPLSLKANGQRLLSNHHGFRVLELDWNQVTVALEDGVLFFSCEFAWTPHIAERPLHSSFLCLHCLSLSILLLWFYV